MTPANRISAADRPVEQREPVKQCVQSRQLVARSEDRGSHVADKAVGRTRVRHQHIDHGGLRHVGIEAADRAFAHHGAAIERHGAQHGIEIGRWVRQHAQQNAGGERRHHLVGDRALQLRVGVAARQRLGAGGEIEEHRCEVGKGQAERAEYDAGMLGHAAFFRADDEAPAAHIAHGAQV